MLDSSAFVPASVLPCPDFDQLLMTRFQAGDQAAFAELYERHFDAVLRACQRILGAAGAADVAHDTFVTAFERRQQWSPQPGIHAVRAWLTTIATRKCLDLVRRASTRKECAETPDADVPIDPEITDHRCRTLLARALETLPREQREVVMMKVDEDLTYREIAERTGVPEPALKSRFRLAREKLSRFLEAAGVTRADLDA